MKLICGDSLKLIAENLSDNSIHAVITDPPYGIGLFSTSGLKWDINLPDPKIWQECFRVLRPGGFCLAFGSTRVYHRLACDIENAGFLIKDCLCYGFASGFPKSYNVSVAIDEHFGAEREVIAKRIHPTLKNNPSVKSKAYLVESFESDKEMESWDITAPATEDAKTWNGWGTQLKPCWEPIVLAQKPIEKNYVHNILKWKVGALNIDECRIPYASEEDKKSLESFLHFENKDFGDDRYFSANSDGKKQVNIHPDGRWPGNILFLDPLFAEYNKFFLIPKPATSEKKEYNTHESVKPIRLMERLVNLVAPKPSVIKEEVIVLDPFLGSGTTAIACKKLGRDCVGYEINQEYLNIALRRIEDESIGYYDIFER